MDSSNKIRVGIICECKKGSNFGWLYAYYGQMSIFGEKPISVKLFYIFNKSKEFCAKNGTIVAFISLNDSLGHAAHVKNINEIPFLHANSDNEVKQKRNENLLPYWEIHYPWRFDYCCLVYPYKKDKSKPLEMHYNILGGKDLEIFKILYSIHKSDFTDPPLEKIASDLRSIRNYVNSFSLEEGMETYKCGEGGYFQSRPGRDDSFITTTYKEIGTEDEFIRSLIPLGKEVDSYACFGRGLDDEDYDTIDVEQTEAGKKILRDKYSKELHLAFLTSLYFEKYYLEKNEYENLLSQLNQYKLTDRFRYDNFGYGNFTQEYLSEKIKTQNERALSQFEKYREIK